MKNLKKIEGWKNNTIKKIKLLNEVKFLTKKNGEPFKVLSKNFNFPIIEEESLIARKYLYLNNDYKICLTHVLEKNNFDDILNKNISSDRVVKEPMIKPYYNLNLEEIKEKIEKEKEKLNQYLIELNEIEKNYKNYINKINSMNFENICDTMKNLKGSLKYLIQDYITERLNLL